MSESKPIVGVCDKCLNTNKSNLFPSPNRKYSYLCPLCHEEEAEDREGKVIRDEQFVADYRNIVSRVTQSE